MKVSCINEFVGNSLHEVVTNANDYIKRNIIIVTSTSHAFNQLSNKYSIIITFNKDINPLTKPSDINGLL